MKKFEIPIQSGNAKFFFKKEGISVEERKEIQECLDKLLKLMNVTEIGYHVNANNVLISIKKKNQEKNNVIIVEMADSAIETSGNEN